MSEAAPIVAPVIVDSDVKSSPVVEDKATPVVAQPAPATMMSTTPATFNKNPLNLPIDQVTGLREFSTGLFSCMDDPTMCLKSWCLPCCTYSLNKQRLVALQTTGKPLPDKTLKCDADSIIYGALGLASCCWVVEMGQRGEVRQRYGISGSTLSDCGATWALQVCCGGTSICSQTQIHRELLTEENAWEAQYGHQNE